MTHTTKIEDALTTRRWLSAFRSIASNKASIVSEGLAPDALLSTEIDDGKIRKHGPMARWQGQLLTASFFADWPAGYAKDSDKACKCFRHEVST